MRWHSRLTKRVSGPDHPNVAIRLNNLAQLWQDMNRLGGAEPLYRRALAIHEKSSARRIRRLPTASTTLRICCGSRTGWRRPNRSIAGRWRLPRTVSAPAHPEVATDLNNLAGLLRATNRLAEAEPLIRRVLEI